MDFITTKFKSTVHLDGIKTKIEDIVNIIAKELCHNQSIGVNGIELKIKDAYPEYRKLCTVAGSTSTLNPDCTIDDQIIFNQNRLQNIITQMKNNRDFVRMCKFKFGVISGSDLYRNIPLSNVIYSLSNYNLQRMPYTISHRMPGVPVIIPKYFALAPYNMHMFGGQLNKIKDGEIGKLIDVDTIKSVKLVDFDEFEQEYKMHPQQTSDVTNAYKLITTINQGQANIIDILDEIEILLNALKYFVVPIKTYNKYILIKKRKHIN